MKTQYILAAAVGLFIIARASSVRRVIGPNDQYVAGSDWFEDAWARIHGRDLSLDGNNPLPDGYDAYGMTGAMGWNYQWNGGLNTVGRA